MINIGPPGARSFGKLGDAQANDMTAATLKRVAKTYTVQISITRLLKRNIRLQIQTSKNNNALVMIFVFFWKYFRNRHFINYSHSLLSNSVWNTKKYIFKPRANTATKGLLYIIWQYRLLQSMRLSCLTDKREVIYYLCYYLIIFYVYRVNNKLLRRTLQ